jgi:glycosyltransferase involved in cell wall biosynthesis
MNKLMEYMALGRAVVSCDLVETRVSGGDAVFYAQGNRAEDLAKAVIALADNPGHMRKLQRAGLERVRDVLNWAHQAPQLVQVYEKLFPGCALSRDRRHPARASAPSRVESEPANGAGDCHAA